MPIRQFLGTTPFNSADFDAMNKAFSAALEKLGLRDLNDPMTEIVAHRIIDAVLTGERDPIRLAEIGAGGRELNSGD